MRDGFGGGVNSADRGIPYYVEMINNLARSLIQEINNQHIQGWSDHPEGSKTNILFFDSMNIMDDRENPPVPVDFKSFIRYYDYDMTDPDNPVLIGPLTGPLYEPAPENDSDLPFAFKRFEIPPYELSLITAKNLTLSNDIQLSPYNIAVSSVEIGRPLSDGTSGEPAELQRGNNLNMNSLYDLFRKTGMTVNVIDPVTGVMVTKDIGSFDDYGTTIRFDVGNTLHTSKQAMETARILTLSANNQRTSVAGVSLDEEMVGLVKFNHAYNGAARVITQMDDALDRLINGTGRVGL